MENLDVNFFEKDKTGLDAEGRGYLLETAKWGRFLSIVAFVFIALMAVLSFSAGAIFSYLGNMSPAGNVFTGAMGAALTVIYLIFAALWFFPTLYMFKFSTKTIKALKTSSESLTDAFKNLKSSFKFFGVMTIVVLSFYAIAFLFMGIGLLAR